MMKPGLSAVATRPPEMRVPTMAPPGASKVLPVLRNRYKSVKGGNYASGVGYDTWLTTGWLEATNAGWLDFLVAHGVTDLRVWLFTDVGVNKDANWGTAAWVPAFSATYRANFETFVRLCRARGIRVFATLLVKSGGVPPNFFDPDALNPAWRGPNLLGTNLNNGGMETATGQNPDNWALTLGSATTETYYSDEAQGEQPGGGDQATHYVKFVKTTTSQTILESPKVAYDGSLVRLDINLQGSVAITPTINYYDDAGNLKQTAPLTQITLAGGGVWETYTTASHTNPPMGASQIAISITIAVASTVYIGGCRIAYGDRSPLWNNYVLAVREWCRIYNDQTEVGSNISAWNLFNEIYDNIGAVEGHPFAVDLYQAIKSVTRTPVAMDSAQSFRWVGTAGNERYYLDCSDEVSIHLYDTDPAAFPDMSNLGTLLWTVGEVGYSIASSGGTRQVETALCAGTVSTAGTMIVTVSSSLFADEVEIVDVALNDTNTVYAAKIRRALMANAVIAAKYVFPIADAGTAQVETATVVGTITGAGNATITVRAAGMPNSPIALSVAVDLGDTASEVARKMGCALTNNTDISAWFYIAVVGAVVTLTAQVEAANDSTMNMAIANGTCAGLTAATTSTNTTAGSSTAKVALTRRIQTEANDAALLISIAKGTAVGPSDVTSTNTTAGVLGGYADTLAVLPSFAADALRQGCDCFMPWSFNGPMAVVTYYPVLTASPALEWERDWTA